MTQQPSPPLGGDEAKARKAADDLVAAGLIYEDAALLADAETVKAFIYAAPVLPVEVREAARLLRRCADDLHAELLARYGDDHAHYPGIRRKFEADMEIVTEAREFLSTIKGDA